MTEIPDTVILLGTDTPIGLAIVRDLGRHGFNTVGIGHSATALASRSRYCTRHEVRAGKNEVLIEQIEELARRHNARFLLAISEGDLLTINRFRDRLEKVITPLTPTSDRLSRVLDKTVCQDHAEKAGIRVPATWNFDNLEQARRDAPGLTYPLVLKWADPNLVAGRLEQAGLELIKTAYARTPEDLIEQLAPYEAIGAYPMVQEYCPGKGLGQMFLMKDGEAVLEFQHERLHEWPPEGGVSSLCRSLPLTEHEGAREKSRALLKDLDWTGVAMVEYRYDPATGTYYFMEINGRFWGSLPLAIAAGAPFAAGLVTCCGRNEPVQDQGKPYALLQCCYWIPESKRLLRLLIARRRIRDPFYRPDTLKSLAGYLLAPLRPDVCYYVFQWRDSGPFFADLANILKKISSNIFQR
ncbi:carboxylate--amine ligase [Emcibacter sp.]|uniref:carboxylate--amine ligase n=1 Tax=Emcibacter sp. TaxID=1979954 RepID=UPI003A907AB5